MKKSVKKSARVVAEFLAEGIVGTLIIYIFMATFVDPGSSSEAPPSWVFQLALAFAWCPLFWALLLPGWLVGWTLFALIGQLRRSIGRGETRQAD